MDELICNCIINKSHESILNQIINSCCYLPEYYQGLDVDYVEALDYSILTDNFELFKAFIDVVDMTPTEKFNLLLKRQASKQFLIYFLSDFYPRAHFTIDVPMSMEVLVMLVEDYGCNISLYRGGLLRDGGLLHECIKLGKTSQVMYIINKSIIDKDRLTTSERNRLIVCLHLGFKYNRMIMCKKLTQLLKQLSADDLIAAMGYRVNIDYFIPFTPLFDTTVGHSILLNAIDHKVPVKTIEILLQHGCIVFPDVIYRTIQERADIDVFKCLLLSLTGQYPQLADYGPCALSNLIYRICIQNGDNEVYIRHLIDLGGSCNYAIRLLRPDRLDTVLRIVNESSELRFSAAFHILYVNNKKLALLDLEDDEINKRIEVSITRINGSPLNATPQIGQTLLSYFVMARSHSMNNLMYLLKRGADPSSRWLDRSVYELSNQTWIHDVICHVKLIIQLIAEEKRFTRFKELHLIKRLFKYLI